jgi:hypothetical protein
MDLVFHDWNGDLGPSPSIGAPAGAIGAGNISTGAIGAGATFAGACGAGITFGGAGGAGETWGDGWASGESSAGAGSAITTGRKAGTGTGSLDAKKTSSLPIRPDAVYRIDSCPGSSRSAA